MFSRLSSWAERHAQGIFLWPAAGLLLIFSLFPLIISLYLSVSRVKFVRGGVDILFVGWDNYDKLINGSQQKRFLGVLDAPGIIGWLIVGLVACLMLWMLIGYVRTARRSIVGFLFRLIFAAALTVLVWMLVSTLSGDGRPGTLFVTLIYVYVGITAQYLIGLGLALLASQPLPGRRFFRVIYLIPMMITPVGVAYMFRMLADTSKGPFAPIWQGVGLGDFSWAVVPWGARSAVMIGDTWQWVPFMFIVLLAAIEGQQQEPVEAAWVDGATRWQIFRHITLPQILPVSTAVVLIRMIEAFKIVDLPQVLTNGGPGTATESLTLHSFIAWRTMDIGSSAAIAYILLVVVTIFSIAFVNLVRGQTTEVV